MPKRGREPEEEQELNAVCKRVKQIDCTPVGQKRSLALEEFTPLKRQRTVLPIVTYQHKADEYRACIIQLFKMNKRLQAKVEFLKHEADTWHERYDELYNRTLAGAVGNKPLALPWNQPSPGQVVM